MTLKERLLKALSELPAECRDGNLDPEAVNAVVEKVVAETAPRGASRTDRVIDAAIPVMESQTCVAEAVRVRDRVKLFLDLVAKHDMTYTFSDDQRVWERGNESMKAIRAAAKELPLEVVEKIWSDKVKTCVAEKFRKNFVWRG
jgi:hypothetical protein